MPETAAPPASLRQRISKTLFGFVPSTVPGCAAVLTGLFLACVVAVVWTVFYFDANNVPWRHAIGIPRIVLVVLLVFFVPVIFYLALRLWLEGEKSLYPEIDNAWKAGMQALEAQGLDIRELAFFLIIGSRGIGQERAIMQTGQLDLRVDCEPDGPAPLHWYATADAVYLFCTDASWTSALAAKRQRHYEEFGDQKRPTPPPTRSAIVLPGSLGRNAPSDPNAGTVMFDQFLKPTEMSQGTGGQAVNLGGTVEIDPSLGSKLAQAANLSSDSGTEWAPITINSIQASERIGRLSYLCQKIVKVRRPISPINGILALLPQGAIDRGGTDAVELQRAVKSDLSSIRYGLQVRCPVTALVVDMERQSGFRELMRRVGKERVAGQRFGRRYDPRSLATSSEMDLLTEWISGTIEDWVYSLFREDQALTRPGNQQLYLLLCDFRCNLKKSLASVLKGAFAYDPEECTTEDTLLFSGCYLAATGERADQRAFVGGILKKLSDEQEILEWTTDTLLEQQRWERISTVGLVVAALMVVLGLWQYFG